MAAEPDRWDGFLRDLLEEGVAVGDGLIDLDVIHALGAQARAHLNRRDFQPARVGAQGSLERRPEIRGDSIHWLDAPLQGAEWQVSRIFDDIRCRLNAAAYLGLFDLEMHYAWYPPGAGYARHVDQPRDRGQRKVSLVLYLNEQWVPPDGGQLRLYEEPGGVAARDIEPVLGRLVMFLTAGREHEVLPNRRGRSSLCGWFRVRD